MDKELVLYVAVTNDGKIALFRSEDPMDEDAATVVINPEEVDFVVASLLEAKKEIEEEEDE